MLKFNLLPPEGKEELEREEISFSFNRLLRVLFFLLIIFLVLLLNIYFCLDILVKAQKDILEKRKESLLFKESQALDQEIAKANSKIKRIYNLQKNFIYFSPIVEEMANLISSIEGVYLNSVEISPETETIPLEEPQPLEEKETQELKSEEEEKEPEVIKKEYFQVEISGFARDRKAVLEIEKSLKSSPYFIDVVSPLENIISPTNINFIFTFKLNSHTKNFGGG